MVTILLSKTCPCGKVFQKQQNHSVAYWKTKTFCSRACINKGRVAWNKGKAGAAGSKNPRYKGPRICEFCGGEFKRSALSRKFCSQICSYKGKKVWNKGTKGLQVAWNKGIKAPWLEGDRNASWKGEGVGKVALHSWVTRKLGRPNKCEECGLISDNPRKIQWANKSGDYKRELGDWKRLCVPCHKRYDLERIRNLLCNGCKHKLDTRRSVVIPK